MLAFIQRHTGTQYCKPSNLTSIRLSPMGYLCNHNCPMCWRQDVPKENRTALATDETNNLTISEYGKLFSEAPITLRTVDIQGGGEPLLYPHINELLTLIKKRNIRGCLITNGCLLSDTHMSTLISCKWDEVRFSVNAGSAAVYKKVNGVDDYKNVTDRITALKKKRGKRTYPIITLFYVLQKDNINDIKAFIRLTEKLRVDKIYFSFLSPYTAKHLMMPSNAVQQTIRYLQKIRPTLHVKHNIHDALLTLKTYAEWGKTYRQKSYFRDKYCQIVQSNLEFSSQGLAVPCCFAYDDHPFSTIREKTITQIWKETQAFRIKMAKGRFFPFCYKNCSWDLAKKSQRDVDPS